MQKYRVEFEYFDNSEKTTSDGLSGGPEGCKRIWYNFEANSDVDAPNKAVKIVEKLDIRRLKSIELLRSISFPMPDQWDNTEPDLQALAPAMITKIPKRRP